MKLAFKTIAFLAFIFPAFAYGQTNTFQEGAAAYDKGDFITANRILTPFATQGDKDAQNKLGVMYLHGEGVNRVLTIALPIAVLSTVLACGYLAYLGITH